MPRVSKTREVSQQQRSLFVDDFYSAVTSLKDKDEVKAFFDELLTREEKLMLAKRFQIAMMLKLGYLWKEIDERVKVTQVTISKLRQKLDFGLKGLDRVAQRIILIKKEKLKRIEQGRSKREDLGTAMVKGGLGILAQKSKQRRKRKSISA